MQAKWFECGRAIVVTLNRNLLNQITLLLWLIRMSLKGQHRRIFLGQFFEKNSPFLIEFMIVKDFYQKYHRLLLGLLPILVIKVEKTMKI